MPAFKSMRQLQLREGHGFRAFCVPTLPAENRRKPLIAQVTSAAHGHVRAPAHRFFLPPTAGSRN
jgi:hypothetical protein